MYYYFGDIIFDVFKWNLDDIYDKDDDDEDEDDGESGQKPLFRPEFGPNRNAISPAK